MLSRSSLVLADLLGCLPSALVGNDGEASLACITEKERLDNAELPNRGDKFGKGLGVNHLAGLVRVGFIGVI